MSATDLDLDSNHQSLFDITVMRRVHYGHSDIAEAVKWFLNEDSEAADGSGKYAIRHSTSEFHNS